MEELDFVQITPKVDQKAPEFEMPFYDPKKMMKEFFLQKM